MRERGKRTRERRGLCRACELSSGRRRHWKNRTEINRSVSSQRARARAFPLACSFTIFSALVPVPLVPSTDSPRLLLSLYLHLSRSRPVFLLVFQHFSFLPPLLLLPRLAPFLSQAPGVYSVIARPSRTTALDFRRRSLDFHLIPPFPRSISFRTTSLLCLPSSYGTFVRRILHYLESMCDFINILLSYKLYILLTFITT